MMVVLQKEETLSGRLRRSDGILWKRPSGNVSVTSYYSQLLDGWVYERETIDGRGERVSLIVASHGTMSSLSLVLLCIVMV